MPGSPQEGARTGGWKYQAGHGFRRGQPVYLQSVGKYALATIDTGFDGLVGDIRLQQFELVTGGEISNLTNLATNVVYSLSPTPGTLIPGSTYPVFKALAPDTASIVSANTGTTGTDVVLPYVFSVTPLGSAVPIAGPDGTLDPGWIPAAPPPTPGGIIGEQIFDANFASEVRTLIELEPVGKTLTYTGDLLTGTSDAYGTQVLSYDVNGRLTSIVGTGRYLSKTFTYTGDQLTSISVP